MEIIAVGVPSWPDVGVGWDPWPLLGVALALLLVRRVLGLRLGWAVLTGCAVAGTLFASAVGAFGVPAAFMVVAVVTATLGLLRRASDPRRDPRDPV